MKCLIWRLIGCTVAGVIVLSSVIGCGGGSGGGPSADGGLTPQQIQGVLTSVEQKIASLPLDESHQTSNAQELVNSLKTLPEISNAGIDEDKISVWVNLRGGGRISVWKGINQPVTGSLTPSSKVSKITRAANDIQADNANDFPLENQARCLDTFEDHIGSSTKNIRSMLSGNGYLNVSSYSSVDDLKKVSGDGLFYFFTHGKREDGEFSLFTSSPISLQSLKDYSQDFNSGNVSITWAWLGGSPYNYGFRWTIRNGFVKKYMKFGKNSFVFFNACESDTESFKQLCSELNVSVYAGWTRTVHVNIMNNVAPLVIEKMLGDKAGKRPIDYRALKAQLQGLDKDPSNGSELVFTQLRGSFSQLAPSIDSATYDKTSRQITINGTFGSDPGTDYGIVKLGTKALSRVGNNGWTSTQLLYSAEGIAPGTYNLSVTVRDHKSNNYGVNLPIQVAGYYSIILHKEVPDSANYWQLFITVGNDGRITEGRLHRGGWDTPISTSVSGNIDSSYNFNAQTTYTHENPEFSFTVKLNGKLSLNSYGQKYIAGEFETIVGSFPDYRPAKRGYFQSEIY